MTPGPRGPKVEINEATGAFRFVDDLGPNYWSIALPEPDHAADGERLWSIDLLMALANAQAKTIIGYYGKVFAAARIAAPTRWPAYPILPSGRLVDDGRYYSREDLISYGAHLWDAFRRYAEDLLKPKKENKMPTHLTAYEIQICEAIQQLDDKAWADAAKFLALPAIAQRLVERSFQTPYTHLDGYMDRFWLLNPYDFSAPKGARELPSARIHHILRRDLDEHPHDHPWDARTIILKGWYDEERLLPNGEKQVIRRVAGDTAELKFGEYHRIVEVSEGGVWTLFITFGYQGTWGFLEDGKKVPWREYLAKPRPGRSGTPATTAAAGA